MSIYRIDYTLDEIKLLKAIIPTDGKNSFTFVTVDNSSNLWYTEVIANRNNSTKFNNLELNYINDETIESISITKETDEYVYGNLPTHETYIRVEVKNIYEELLERTIQVDIDGPAQFKQNNLTRLVLKSSKTDYIQIPIIINGVGEVKYIVKATNKQ